MDPLPEAYRDMPVAYECKCDVVVREDAPHMIHRTCPEHGARPRPAKLEEIDFDRTDTRPDALEPIRPGEKQPFDFWVL